MPVVFQLLELHTELSLEKIAGVHGVIFENVVHGIEFRLVVLYHTGIRSNIAFAVGEGIKGIDGFVRRHACRNMYEDVHLVGGHIFYFPNLDFPLVSRLEYGVDYSVGGFPVRDFGNSNGVSVYFFDSCTQFHAAAAAPFIVFAAIGKSAGREVRVDFVWLAFEDFY